MQKTFSKTLLFVGIIFSFLLAFLIPKPLFAASSFFDDFNSLNQFQVSNGWSNGGMFNCTWRSNAVRSQNGFAQLSILSDSNGGYAGGEISTSQKYGYGLYEVRMKPAKNSGIVSSFFTYTGPSYGTQWDEIDIEFLGKNTNIVQFNYYTNGVGNHEYVYSLGFDASTSFHTYAFDWKPNSITWYVDGRAVYTATTNIPSTPGKIMMNIWPGTSQVNDWLGAYNGATNLNAYYDWVKFTPSNSTPPTSNIFSNGTYTIANKRSQMALDGAGTYQNANVQQWGLGNGTNQQWQLISTGSNTYKIKNVASGRLLSVRSSATYDGALVEQRSDNNTPDQLWEIYYTEGSYCKILNKASGKALSIQSGSTSEGALAHIWPFQNGEDQKWLFTKK
ncbi:beta-glucanase [Cellulosilyticum lentocellum]|uniref:Beta-glucanase n=1 Tax=Cellulosilyticum lentocellum (strain ATCC 49066 / DSM 5427 / NCIMB 11756 / RHM5) TaxID=642492 RepID=F2JKE0_CELLD|nr:family 16 glycosylhydrolase [Cellulosilyticum lentocellum]ADZ85655.1 glycoside hydrolase family 16 [Cellulosilyticum lentocellum DSM 5427]